MNILFSILSIIYISAIFILAGSPIVRILAPFNIYSLLHIPLYGILTALLILSFVPIKIKSTKPLNPTNSTNPINSINSITRFLVVGVIALGVGIADEIYQAYVPGRDASITDVLLDMVGIILVLFFVLLFHKKQKSLKSQSTQ
jgi:membrane protease YdiL (CAAX protease family)